MKKVSTYSVNSLTHCSTSVFELKKGEGFYSEIPNVKGAERLYEVTLKKGKKYNKSSSKRWVRHTPCKYLYEPIADGVTIGWKLINHAFFSIKHIKGME